MRCISLAFVMVFLCGCAAAVGRAERTCRPTGWVDRVEGLWVVIESDGEDAETLVLPVSCFREPVRGGLRVVEGHIDRDATEAMRRRMAETASPLVKTPDD